MQGLIEYSLRSRRTVLLLFAFFILAGAATYKSIPKESAPDVKIPIIHTMVNHRGIAPSDAEQLIVKPIEEELRKIEGVKRMTSEAFSGGGSVTLQFHAGQDLDRALADVRQRVNMAKANLPDDSNEPEIKEMNVSQFPVLVVNLSGTVPERTLFKASQDLQYNIESNKSVLEAPIVGGRDEVIHLFVDPVKLESYGLDLGHVMGMFKSNHLMVASGPLKSGSGEVTLKTPGLIKHLDEIREMPIRVNTEKNIVVRFKDVGVVMSAYEDPKSYARDRGLTSLSLEVSKRTGENIIKTIASVRKTAEEFVENLSSNVKVSFAQDNSERIYDMLKDLQNNIILAILLVMLVIVRSLGWRSSFLVGASIPTSFLSGILVIGLLGYTLNMIVLFSLILSVGMLVDGAIIVVEYADRKMLEGSSPFEAYRDAAIRMRWPVFTSTITVLLVFLPLMFWPGIMGQFMKYLPLTLLATLTASLFVALVFVPTLGSIFGRPQRRVGVSGEAVLASDQGSLADLEGSVGWYVRLLDGLLDNSKRVLGVVALLLVGIIFIYGKFGRGIEFFPETEPDSAAYVVRARGNLSLEEKDRLIRLVEEDLLSVPHFKTISSQAKEKNGSDVIGRVMVELVDWRERPKANQIFEETLQKVRRHPGILIEVKKKKKGPSSGKHIQILVRSDEYKALAPEVRRVRSFLEGLEGIEDIEDSRPIPGLFEWEVKIDRAEAAKFGLDIKKIGQALEALMGGVKVGTYRPSHSRQEVEMRVRFPKENRTLSQLEQIRIQSKEGLIPLSYVAKWAPIPKVETLERTDGKLSMTVEANVNAKYLVNDKVNAVKEWLEEAPANPHVMVEFKGEEEEKEETQGFLVNAFFISIFLIVIVLVTQFNSFFSTLLVISAILMSFIGVLIGLLVMNLPFSIVMSGIGVIALAGIIVSNNIIFIDTFDILRKEISDVREVILRTGAQRLRPIVLTQFTTVLGLLPVLLQINIDFIGLEMTMGAPSGSWWVQLANAIVFGVFFASILTLIVTPCALMVREQYRARRKKNSF